MSAEATIPMICNWVSNDRNIAMITLCKKYDHLGWYCKLYLSGRRVGVVWKIHLLRLSLAV